MLRMIVFNSVCLYVSTSLNFIAWHQRLDHPSVKVLSQVLKLCNSLLNKSLEFCNAS